MIDIWEQEGGSFFSKTAKIVCVVLKKNDLYSMCQVITLKRFVLSSISILCVTKNCLICHVIGVYHANQVYLCL